MAERGKVYIDDIATGSVLFLDPLGESKHGFIPTAFGMVSVTSNNLGTIFRIQFDNKVYSQNRFQDYGRHTIGEAAKRWAYNINGLHRNEKKRESQEWFEAMTCVVC